MIPACVTISLVPAAKGGPFVFWEDLATAMRQARELGFDAVEVFAPGGAEISTLPLEKLLKETGLKLAAVGTGAGWVMHQLNLTLPDASQRQKAKAFIRGVIDAGAPFGAPAIIGSMQGCASGEVSHEQAIAWLKEALEELGTHAAQAGVPLFYEPLNRYETNLVNRVADGVALLNSLSTKNVFLLADLFHMNIEEVDIAEALRQGGKQIGHLHFVDSNRRPAGLGHLNYGPIATALKEIGYEGYASAEALPWPDPLTAARQTINTYRQVFG